MPPSTGGANAAYRGYRRQLSYTLGRVLAATDEELTFQPEGVEDLAIWRAGRLVEACQIKAVSGELHTSDLRSKTDSFFKRGAVLVREHPQVVLRVVSFGPFGTELKSAVSGDRAAANDLIQKLQDRDGIPQVEAEAVLGRMELERVDEAIVSEGLVAATADLLTAADPKASLDMLHWWMFISAEEQRRLTSVDVRDAVINTGKYVSSWAAHHAEWFTTIEPIMPLAVDEKAHDRLASEFYRGVAARPEHVAAGLDVERAEIVRAIHEGFTTAPVVVVRGASGQGKSTVALRYLHQLPEAWRFRVRSVEDRGHAARIGLALVSQAEQIHLPLIVWIDVSPRDEGWSDLVARLSETGNVRVLVTIREEDWRRSRLPAAGFDYVEVELSLMRAEASQIFESLVERQAAVSLLDFDEAWTKFGGEGPLLEFVHLVTQDASLRERLTEQVARLEDEVRAGTLQAAEIQLLRSVAVASANEARVDTVFAVEALALPAARRTIELFEREYMLRTSTEGTHLAGLHPIRSRILAELLCDPALQPWSTVAVGVLPWIAEADLEMFLMGAFVERPGDRSRLRDAAMAIPARTWTAMAAVGRAMLWLGIAEYAERNRPWIDSLVAENGEAAWLAINRDVAGAMPGADDIIDRLADLVPNSERLRSLSAEAKSKQTTPDEIWSHLRQWLGQPGHRPATPSPAEWSALGHVCFWAGRLAVGIPTEWVTVDEAAADQAELEHLADATLGLTEAGLDAVFEAYRPRLIERFQQETLSARLSDDGEEVKADFVVPLQGSEEATDPCARSPNSVHRETMRRAWLLRRLYPNHEVYACQGYGHRIIDGAHDDTTKRMPRRNLPPDWLTSVNATFAGYLELSVRPATWETMIQELTAGRSAMLSAIRAMDQALTRYQRSSDDFIIGRSLDYHVVDEALRALAAHVRLPAVAVDPWGLVTEGRREDALLPELDSRRPLALDRYRSLVSSTRRWNQAAENFLRAGGQVLATAPLLARRAKDAQTEREIRDAAAQRGIRTDLEALSRLNLRDAMRDLAKMQGQLRSSLALHLPMEVDAAFDAAEREEYLRFASIWDVFTRRPSAHHPDVGGHVKASRSSALRRFKKALAKSQSTLGDIRLTLAADRATWCGQPVLVVVADAPTNALDLLVGGDETIEHIALALQDGGDTGRHLLALAWPAVVLIWTFRGRALDRSAFHFDTDWLEDAERKPDWWRFVPKVRPADFDASVPTPLWDSPAASHGAALVAAVADVWAYASHLADLVELGEIEGEGEAILRRHLDHISAEQSRRLQAAIDALKFVFDFAESPPPKSSSSIASDLTSACQEIHSAILPPGFSDGLGRIRLDDVARWRDSLAEARSLALAARLLVVTLDAE